MSRLDLPVIDSHVHLWNPNRFRLGWLDNIALLNQNYELNTYLEHTQGATLAGFVYLETGVSPHYAWLEARWAAELAKVEPRLLGIVAAAPLEDGERVRAYLQSLVELSPVIKGVRRILQAETDPAFCRQPGFVRGVQLLADYNLSFDICIRHDQLPQVIELVKLSPGITFILDHIGKPAIASGEFANWYENLQQLAALPDVACKVSGLVTEADHLNWTADNLQPYITAVLEIFGSERAMFGSDWPVMLLASSYSHWLEVLNEATISVDEVARRNLWADNARRFYRL